MTQSPETVVLYWKEQREQLRQSENQRATMTNYLLVIVAGLSGFIVQQHFVNRTIAVAALIVIIGVYGALMSAKYHERSRYHLGQARALTRSLAAMGALSDRNVLDELRDEHYAQYPTLSKLRLHWLWTGLHSAIALYGAVLIVIIIAH